MQRAKGLVVTLVALGMLWTAVARAGIPDPLLSTIRDIHYCPAGDFTYQCTIVGSQGPIDQANVQLVFSGAADSKVCWRSSPAQTHPIVSATTNAAGIATFMIAAGGCINPAAVSGGVAVTVFANGFNMGNKAAVSPDAVDGNGKLPTDVGYAPGATCQVGLSDASFHTPALKGGPYAICTDMNGDGAVGLSDATTQIGRAHV